MDLESISSLKTSIRTGIVCSYAHSFYCINAINNKKKLYTDLFKLYQWYNICVLYTPNKNILPRTNIQQSIIFVVKFVQWYN